MDHIVQATDSLGEVVYRNRITGQRHRDDEDMINAKIGRRPGAFYACTSCQNPAGVPDKDLEIINLFAGSIVLNPEYVNG